MTAASLAFFWPLAEAGFSWGGVAERFIAIALSAVATGVVMVYVLKAQITGLADQVGKLAERVDAQACRLADARQERSHCETRAAKTFATREDFAQTFVEAAAGHREVVVKLDQAAKGLRDSVARVHQRVDDVQERLVRAEERINKGSAA